MAKKHWTKGHSASNPHNGKTSGSKISGDVNYASKLTDQNRKKLSNSERDKGKFYKNILDDFFTGIDRGGALTNSPANRAKEFQGYGWDLEEILNSEGITTSRLTSKVLNLTRVNINHAPSQVDFTNFGKMFAFFTKPDLYLFKDHKFNLNQSILDNDDDLAAKIMKNIPVASQLQIGTGKTPSYGSSGGLNYILGNLCNEIEVPEVSLSVTPSAKNSKGQGISYINDFSESLSEGDISVSFIDTRDRDVTTMLEIWAQYAEAVRAGRVFKKPDYIGRNIIDYACTIYIFTVDETMNIQGMMQLVGCFPKTINTDINKYRAEMLTAQNFIGPFNVTFHCSFMSKPNVHRIIESFNYSSGYGDAVLRHLPDGYGDGKLSPHHLTYKRFNGYWHHTGITNDHGYLSSYPYHFTLEDKWAEMVGINQTHHSSGVIQYTLGFASRNVGEAKTYKSFYKGDRYRDISTGEPWEDKGRWDDDVYRSAQNRLMGNWSHGMPYGYSNLDTTSSQYRPYNGGYGALYQGGFETWNAGDSRYGRSTAITGRFNGTDNSNFFRSAIKFLSGR